jgi:hypothetical protein
MKFYIDKHHNIYWSKFNYKKITAIFNLKYNVLFYKNGFWHNVKNAACSNNEKKSFWLNGNHYGYEFNFTKESWRKFVKLQAFL